MSTRPGGLPAPAVSADDAGPWSVTSPVRHARAMTAQVRARRVAEPRFGLVTMPPPRVEIPLEGLDPHAAVAGAGYVRVVAAAREPAHSLEFSGDGDELRAVSPYALRRWTVPALARHPEERDGTDPSTAIPAPVEPSDLAGDIPVSTPAPGGEHLGVVVRDGRAAAVAIIRKEPRALVRWIAGARAVAWNADGTLLAVGGEWGVLLCRAAEPPAGGS